MWIASLIAAFALLLPAPALAQSTPAPGGGGVTPPSTNPLLAAPHPMMPWSLGPATPYGQLIRYFWVPAQQMVIEMPVAQTQAGAVGVQQQVVEVPGYYASETTLGFYYPDRWVIEQVGPGSYRWRLMTAEFRRR
jgi:hypothetical protein